MAITQQRVIRSTSCLVLGWVFLARIALINLTDHELHELFMIGLLLRETDSVFVLTCIFFHKYIIVSYRIVLKADWLNEKNITTWLLRDTETGRFLPLLQLAMVPIQRRPLHVRYQVSCDALHRTVSRSDLRSAHAASGTTMSIHPTTNTTQMHDNTIIKIMIISYNKIHLQTNTESVQCLPVKYHKK